MKARLPWPPRALTPHGVHRVPEPGSFRALIDAAKATAAAPTTTVRVVQVPRMEDTRPFDAAELWTGPLPVQEPGAEPAPDENPPPLVSEVRFDRGVSWGLRRDHAQLPVFRGAVKAHGGFAGLHERAPQTTPRGNLP